MSTKVSSGSVSALVGYIQWFTYSTFDENHS